MKNRLHTTIRHRWFYIIIGIALLLIGLTYGTGVFSRLKGGGFNDPKADSTIEASRAAADFPSASPSLIVLLNDPGNFVESPVYAAEAQPVLAKIAATKGVRDVTSFYNSGETDLVSRDHHQTYALVTLDGSDVDQAATFNRIESSVEPSGNLSVKLGGSAAADSQITDQVKKDLGFSEKISFPFLAILLVVIFRSVVAAALPLIIGSLGILLALTLLRLIAAVTDVSVFATNIVTLLGLGLAIDYSLFFVSRFRDELAKGEKVPDALRVTRQTAGRTILFSGSIVSLSLLSLLVFPEVFLRSMAYGGAMTVFGAMLTALTVLPAILAIIGPRVNRLAMPLPRFKRNPPGTWWHRLATVVTRNYIIVLIVTLFLLVTAGLPFRHAQFGPEDTHNLPAGSSSLEVSNRLSQDFVSGQTKYIEALVTMNGSPTEPANLVALTAYTNKLATVANVRSVSSLVSSMKGLSPAQATLMLRQRANPKVALLLGRYVHDSDTLVMINYDANLSNSQSQALVRAVRTVSPPTGVKVLVGGQAAELVDLLDSLKAHLAQAVLIIVAATVILLGLMLRSIVIPLTAVVLSTVSLSASFGAITWIFQNGHGQGLLGFTSPGFLDSTVPILIFAVAFGLAMDYEAFLISRMREHFDETGDNTESIIFGVTKTGRVISSAALLLIVVILALSSSKIISIKEIGIGLAIAVAVDVVFIRSLLVPATMRLFGKANWVGRRHDSV